jgi:hypothetical protein
MGGTMTLRRSLLGVIAVAMFAVAFSAIGVVNAAASHTEECKLTKAEEENERFTSQHFFDENCEKKSPGAEGEYHTAFISPTAVLETTKTTPIVWHIEFPEAAVAVSCGEVGGKKTVNRIEEGEKLLFKGEGVLKFTGCSVKEPTTCSIGSTIETTNLSLSSEDLLETQRTLYVPKEGSKIASFTISGCAEAGTYTVEGKLRSQTVNIHTEEFGSKTGSELVISKGIPIFVEYWFHEVTAGTKKFITRELP